MPARSTSTRSRSGTSSRPRSGSTAARKRAPAKRSSGNRRPPARSNGGLLRVVGGTWMLVARGAGGLARSVARPEEAEPLAPEHRRDGVGLAWLGLAVVLGASVWTHGIGPVGAVVADGVRWAVGAIVVVLPVFFLFVAAYLLRHPARPEARGRMVIGWFCLTAAVVGIAHVVGGGLTDGPPQGHPGSGGLIGWAVGTPLTKGVGSIVAVVLLILVAFFGLLVITATPVHQIPERLRELSDRMTGRGDYADEDEAYDEDEVEEKPKRRRGRTHDAADFQATGPVDLTPFEEPAGPPQAVERPPLHMPLTSRPVEDRTAPPEDLPPIDEPQQLTIQPVEGDYKLPALSTLRPGTPPRASS